MQDAIPLAEEALSIFTVTLGEDHPNTATSMWVLANCYRDSPQPDMERAEMLGASALRILISRLGEGHPTTRRCAAEWGRR